MSNTAGFNIGILILRLFLGSTMLFHGYAKIQHGISFVKGLLSQNGLPEFLSYGVYIGEIIAPLLVIIGFKLRLATVIIIINIIAAIYLVHPYDLLNLTQNGGLVLELQYFYIATALALFFTGSGQISVDKN